VETVTFNCLVTTYEFVMRDATVLSKVPWKYLIIDEAQRMKDRDSKLAKAFDRFVFDKRLLLTGTPLQNELRELWSLLNLLLPELFNDKAQFARWFADALAKSQGPAAGQEDELINTEKRVVVVNRCGFPIRLLTPKPPPRFLSVSLHCQARRGEQLVWLLPLPFHFSLLAHCDSKLAKAFDRFVFDTRLLLTGTLLQNERREL
jgi:SNF2 family DNA or RNA helicase